MCESARQQPPSVAPPAPPAAPCRPCNCRPEQHRNCVPHRGRRVVGGGDSEGVHPDAVHIYDVHKREWRASPRMWWVVAVLEAVGEAAHVETAIGCWLLVPAARGLKLGRKSLLKKESTLPKHWAVVGRWHGAAHHTAASSTNVHPQEGKKLFKRNTTVIINRRMSACPAARARLARRGAPALLRRMAAGATLYPGRADTIVLHGGYGHATPTSQLSFLGDLVQINTVLCLVLCPVLFGTAGYSGASRALFWRAHMQRSPWALETHTN